MNSGNYHDVMIPLIAKDAGMDQAATADTMSTFTFPSVGEQLGDSWLGVSGEAFLKGVADVFVEAESIPSARGSYANAINSGPLEAVAVSQFMRFMGN